MYVFSFVFQVYGTLATPHMQNKVIYLVNKNKITFDILKRLTIKLIAQLIVHIIHIYSQISILITK